MSNDLTTPNMPDDDRIEAFLEVHCPWKLGTKGATEFEIALRNLLSAPLTPVSETKARDAIIEECIAALDHAGLASVYADGQRTARMILRALKNAAPQGTAAIVQAQEVPPANQPSAERQVAVSLPAGAAPDDPNDKRVLVDMGRVIKWFYSKPRKSAVHAFTAGDERQIAYLLEEASVPSSATQARTCPYCTSDNPAIRSTYYDQTCEGCVKRMGQP